MKPRITVITVCVDDLERSFNFYRDGLGLKSEGITGKEFEHGAVAFFELQHGLRLAVWPRKSLANDSGIPSGAPSATEFSLGHNVSSKAEGLLPRSGPSSLGGRLESAMAIGGVLRHEHSRHHHPTPPRRASDSSPMNFGHRRCFRCRLRH
jgi:uncharacterized protein